MLEGSPDWRRDAVMHVAVRPGSAHASGGSRTVNEWIEVSRRARKRSIGRFGERLESTGLALLDRVHANAFDGSVHAGVFDQVGDNNHRNARSNSVLAD